MGVELLRCIGCRRGAQCIPFGGQLLDFLSQLADGSIEFRFFAVKRPKPRFDELVVLRVRFLVFCEGLLNSLNLWTVISKVNSSEVSKKYVPGFGARSPALRALQPVSPPRPSGS